MADVTLRFSAEGGTKDRLQPLSLIDAVAKFGKGLASAQAAPEPLYLHAPQISAVVDPWLLWEHLGDFATAEHEGVSAEFKIPDPQDVVPLLEHSRVQWLNMLRMPLEQARVHVAGSGVFNDEQLALSLRQSAHSYLTMLTVMLLYVREHWKLLPDPPHGVLAGLAQEIELWAAALPPRDQRHPESQAVLDRFGIQIERLVGHRIPHLGHPQPRARTGGRARELFDGSRLERYFKRPGCLGIRALRRNRYNYLAVLFNGNRVVVDTAQKENRLFLFRGPLADILAGIDGALASGQIKQVLEQHPLCVGGHEHDEEGERQLAVFLA